MTARRLLQLLSSVLTMAVLGAAYSCVTDRETHRTHLAPLPDSYMNAMGLQAYEQAKAETPVAKDQALTARVLDIGRKVAAATGGDFAWEFTLFDSSEVNAWCLPGGKVGVFTGILPVAKTNAGLAAVLGHEIGHAIARHGGERMSQQLLLTGAMLTAEQVLKDSKSRPLAMAALGLGAKFGVVLPFSRLQESEADHLGMLYMARAGFDPSEAIALWQRMAARGGEPPEILSDHPSSESRVAAMAQQLPEAMAIYQQTQKIPTASL